MSDGPVVGVVGGTDEANGTDGDDEAIRSAVESAGGRIERGPAATVAGSADYLVAVGEPSLLALARTGTEAPVLPIGTGSVRSVPTDGGPAAVEHLLADEYGRERHPLVEVTVADRLRARALLDVTLITADPGAISEYGVHAGGERVARLRADGVVAATPAGSGGYARRAGGPIVEPGTGVLSIVPIAPFETDPSHWVLSLSGVSLSVERDENAVHLLVDGRVVGHVRPGESVRLSSGGTFTVAAVGGSRSPFEG